MSEDSDESHILERALELLQSDQNPLKDDPLKQVTLPTRCQTMIHRAIAEVSRSSVNRVWIREISTRFCFIHEEREFPITEATVFDLYHGRKTRLNFIDQACCGVDSTFCVLSIVPINFDDFCWLDVIVLFSKSNHFLCLAEINLTNSELIVHQMENLNFEEHRSPAIFQRLLPNWNTNTPTNNMSLFFYTMLEEARVYDHGKKIDLQYHSPKSRIPTMIIQNGPVYKNWRLNVRHFIDKTAYGFEFKSAGSPYKNYSELIVANWEAFPPYDLKNIERRKISDFSKYEDGKPELLTWHGNACYLLQTKNSTVEVICFTLETLVWRSIIKYEHNFLAKFINIVVEENELVLMFFEYHSSIPNNARIYDCMIFPIGRPLSLSKLALFSVYHFNHRDPKYGKKLELIHLQASLKPLPNSTKLQSIQNV